MLKVLQVCNVGRIVGGTAACAWTVTKSLPDAEHTVAFLSPMSPETREAFSHCRLARWERVTASQVVAADPDVVVLHNTPHRRAEQRLPAVTIQYLHSKIVPATADLTLFCSRWLARHYGADLRHVCLQAVPRPRRPEDCGEARALREFPVIGRICTPQSKKWPAEVIDFYAGLASRFRRVKWEFVGCPVRLQAAVRGACGGNALFLPASWSIRSRLWQWDALLYHNRAVTESFGRTVGEAMRAGCIPIVDGRGGFTEQVVEGCGFLCRREGEFAEAVARLLRAGERFRISRACRAHADEAFSLARFGTELIRRFHEAGRKHG